jgi:hypothetical protein
MTDKPKNFHSFALKSSLFKGHTDWYFCFLKSERIAHVISILSEYAKDERETFEPLLENASMVPSSIAHLAAGEMDLAQVLAELFSLIVSIRLLSTGSILTKDTARILVDEYEALAEKLDAGTRLSPFATSDDFLIQPMTEKSNVPPPAVAIELLKKALTVAETIKDTPKGQDKPAKQQNDRYSTILSFVQNHSGVSIKDISAVVKECSEKTIQRELTEMIRQGLIRRVGERRWSLYEPI